MSQPPAPRRAPTAVCRKGELPAWRWVELRFLLILLFPAVTLLTVWTQPSACALQTAFIYLLFVAIDALVPGAQHSPGPVVSSAYMAGLVRFYAPLQLALQVSAAWVAWHSSWPVVLGLAFSVGVIAGTQGISNAHELGHSPYRLDKLLAWVLMTSVCYAHFMVEHYRGHHPRAATYEDPATARRGENLWRFLGRTLRGSWFDAWRLEARRLNQFKQPWGQSPMAWALMANAVILLALISAMLLKPLVFWLVQAALAIWLLETVNYIGHYGLQREKRGHKREPFGPMHAWNADHLMSNCLLINLQRRSDHHVNTWKPYAMLADLQATPRLPTGYAGCILLAAVPPVWFAVMEPRLAQLKAPAGSDDDSTQPSVLGDVF